MLSTLYCQDLAGQWSGTLNASGNQIRVVSCRSKTPPTTEVTMDSSSQNVSGVSVGA